MHNLLNIRTVKRQHNTVEKSWSYSYMFPFMFLKSGAFLGFILQQYGCTTAMKGREDSLLEIYSEASLNGILSLLK